MKIKQALFCALLSIISLVGADEVVDDVYYTQI